MTDETYDGNSFAQSTWFGLDTYTTGGTYAYGERAANTGSTLIGRFIQDIQFYTKRGSGTGSGTVSAVMRDDSNTLLHTFWTALATTISETPAWTSNTTSAYNTAMAEGDYFALESTANNDPIVYAGRNDSTTTDRFDTNISNATAYLPYDSDSEKDCYFKMTYTTSAPTSGATFMPPPIAHVRL